MRYGSAPSSTYSLRTTRLPHCHTLHTIQLCVTFVIYPTGAKPPTPDRTTGAHPPHTHPAPSATDTPADTCEHTASVNSPTNTQPSSSTHSLIGLHPQRIVVEVQGMEYDLPIPTNQIFEAAVAMAIRYSTLLTRKPARTPPIYATHPTGKTDHSVFPCRGRTNCPSGCWGVLHHRRAIG